MTRRRKLSPAGEMRLLAGLVTQPFVAAGAAFIALPLIDLGGRPFNGSAVTIDAAIAFALAAGLAAVVVTIVGALPLLLWLIGRGPLTLRQVLLAGAVLGQVPMGFVVLASLASALAKGATPGLANPIYGVIPTLAMNCFVGTASAGVFWWVAGRHLAKFTLTTSPQPS